eukprot:2855275-Rhodomonas_salina.2
MQSTSALDGNMEESKGDIASNHLAHAFQPTQHPHEQGHEDHMRHEIEERRVVQPSSPYHREIRAVA